MALQLTGAFLEKSLGEAFRKSLQGKIIRILKKAPKY